MCCIKLDKKWGCWKKHVISLFRKKTKQRNLVPGTGTSASVLTIQQTEQTLSQAMNSEVSGTKNNI